MTLRAEAYAVADICAVVGLARSTFYHAAEERETDALRQALLTLAGEYPTYGYRRLTALLRRAGWTVNHKRIQRLMRQMGLQRPVKKRKTRTTNSDHPFPRYPSKRIHSALDYLTPAEFEANWLMRQPEPVLK
jgi:putative transposase